METTNPAEIIEMPPGQPGRVKREAARTHRRAVVGIVCIVTLLIAARLLLAPLQRAYAHQQTLNRLEQAMIDDPLFGAVRQANPSEFSRMWAGLSAAVRKDGTPEDDRNTVRAYAGRVTDERLRHATADTLRRTAALRAEMIRTLVAESPVACYEFLTTSGITGYHADLLVDYSRKLGAILAQPVSSTPLPRDGARARQRADAVLNSLTADELAALQYSDKPWTNHNDLCRAMLKIYRGALALPDPECAQVLRYLELFPADDRDTSPPNGPEAGTAR